MLSVQTETDPVSLPGACRALRTLSPQSFSVPFQAVFFFSDYCHNVQIPWNAVLLKDKQMLKSMEKQAKDNQT